MKWFHVITHGNCIERNLRIGGGDLIGVEEWELRRSVYQPHWEVPTLFVIDPEEDGAPDDALVENLGLPTFSPRLQETLAAAGVEGIQYLPVRIVRGSGRVLDGFAIANILTLRRALHRGKSKYTVNPEDYFLPERRGNINGITKYVLNGDVLGGCDLIRLEEYTVAMLCSEKVKRIFDDNGFTGWEFQPVEVVYSKH
jgi:hypothetical protein